MCYVPVYDKKYENDVEMSKGEALGIKISAPLDRRYAYKLRVRGEVAIPFDHRTEAIFPVYFRKLEDSLVKSGDAYALSFNDDNLEYERSCYQMVRADFAVGAEYLLSVKGRVAGEAEKFALSLEVYYGDSHTRYYYEEPDEKHEINVVDGVAEARVIFKDKVDFAMLKLSAIGFKGEAYIEAPTLTDGEKNYVDGFEYAPEKLGEQSWIGEGFSKSNRPKFTLIANGETAFEGRKSDRLHHFAGVEFEIPESALRNENNEFSLRFEGAGFYGYTVRSVQLITLPKQTEILAVAPYQIVGKPFGVLCYFEKAGEISVKAEEPLRYLGESAVDEGVHVLRFEATELGRNVGIEISDGTYTRSVSVACISDKEDDGVITGTGDFIYINQNYADFYEYLAWYLNENIGDMFTLRSCFRWGATSEADPVFWKKAVGLLKELGIYYVLMIDGRELNGVNANPSLDLLKSEYFLGEQTHERDGAFSYWTQEIDEYESFFYHLLSRKLERSGIYGKYSPVYNKKGEPRIYYAGDNVTNVKEAYEELVKNLARTAEQGATRHTGVTPLFDAFVKAGYKWLGYESMYGSHEMILGAIRGISNSIGNTSFGTHLALQWSTMPAYDPAHFVRYRLSLFLSYMHGVTNINTEEGLWTIETPLADHDRFSYTCTEHRKEQQSLSAYIKTHTRRGKQVRNIAMMVGKYDGMDCFSTGAVYGQAGEYWKYNTPEYSWDLLKVFYPEAEIGAIYHFVKKDGGENLTKNEKAYMEARIEIKEAAKKYQSLGYFTSTPYGVIDLITADAQNLSDYKAIFLLGWNTCSREQLERLSDYMENGGKVVMAKPHLYDSISREEVLTGKALPIACPEAERLLSYRNSGNLIFFDKDAYPIEYAEEYGEQLATLGKEYGSRYVRDTKYVSFTEYALENGATALYLIDINWWDDAKATATLTLSDAAYPFTLDGNRMRTVYVSPSGDKAVMLEACDIDVPEITDLAFALSGIGKANVTVFKGGKAESLSLDVKGNMTVSF